MSTITIKYGVYEKKEDGTKGKLLYESELLSNCLDYRRGNKLDAIIETIRVGA